MTEYKFYLLAPDHGLSYEDRYRSLDDARKMARALALQHNEPVYILETIWMCKPKQVLEEQKITETAPQDVPPQ